MWRGLPYSECTWEDSSPIADRFLEQIDSFLCRNQAETIPRKSAKVYCERRRGRSDNVGLGRARPPRCARRAKGPLSVSLMLSRPVMEGMKWSLIASSSGWRSDDMSGPLVIGGGGKLHSSAPGPLVFLGNVRLPSLSGGTSPGYLLTHPTVPSDAPSSLLCPLSDVLN